MNFLVVGFGGIGCRHLQSLINCYEEADYFVVEPSDSVFKTNCNLIGINPERLNRINKFKEIDSQVVDLCVVATTARPRYKIMEKLISKNINHFLIEKVAFQNTRQFDSIIKKSKENKKTIHINFVNRYFSLYQNIRNRIENNLVTMNVSGGQFGLGCNGLHYIDLFEFLTNHKLILGSYNLNKNNLSNKRGKDYKEFTGKIMCNTMRGDNLLLESKDAKKSGVIIRIEFGENIYIINEEKCKYKRYNKKGAIEEGDFEIKYTSELTSIIYRDIIHGSCLLPTVGDSKDIHAMFFHAINNTLKLKVNDICPIT